MGKQEKLYWALVISMAWNVGLVIHIVLVMHGVLS